MPARGTDDCATCSVILRDYNAAARERRNREAMRALARYDAHFVADHRQDLGPRRRI